MDFHEQRTPFSSNPFHTTEMIFLNSLGIDIEIESDSPSIHIMTDETHGKIN
jgi:hypothetical protein